MKKLLILLIFTASLSLSIYPQNDKTLPESFFNNPTNYSRITECIDKISTLKQHQEIQSLKKHDNRQINLVVYKPVKVICDSSNRYTYTYDNSGNCLTELQEIFYTSQYVSNYRFTRTYNSSGNLITELFETFYDNKWIKAQRFTYTYNNEGKQLTRLQEDQYGYCNGWGPTFKSIYTYDNEGNCLTELIQCFSEGVVSNSLIYTYTYDNAGNCLSETFQNCSSNIWTNYYQFTFTYDNNNKYLTEQFEIWENNAWVKLEKVYYLNDNSGNHLSRTAEYWDYYGTWTGSNKKTYTYDNLNNCLSIITEERNSLDTAWINTNKITNSYDNLNNPIEYLEQSWLNHEWTYLKKYKYTYDNYGNCIHAESLSWENGSWTYAPETLELWYNSHKENKYYSAATLNAEYMEIGTTSVNPEKQIAQTFKLEQNYPNPFNPTTRIQYAVGSGSIGNKFESREQFVTLKVYDVLGKEAATLVNEFKSPGSYSINFNANNLASGVYYYQLKTGNNIQTKKMILLR